MKPLQLQGISENVKYIFTNRGVLTTSDFFSNSKKLNFIDYSFENLPMAVDMMRERNELYYNNGKMSLQEYSSEIGRAHV